MQKEQWISARMAKVVFDISHRTPRGGEIQRRPIPGKRTYQYSVSDIEKKLKKSVIQAELYEALII